MLKKIDEFDARVVNVQVAGGALIKAAETWLAAVAVLEETGLGAVTRAEVMDVAMTKGIVNSVNACLKQRLAKIQELPPPMKMGDA